jgi:hypothetical protein
MSVYTVKKGSRFFSSPAWMSFTKLFPAGESLASDIGDGKIANLFYSASLNFANVFSSTYFDFPFRHVKTNY